MGGGGGLKRVVSYFRELRAHRTARLCLSSGLHVLQFWEYQPRNQPFLSIFWGWEGWTVKAEDVRGHLHVCGHLGHWRQRAWLRACLWLSPFHTCVLLPTAVWTLFPMRLYLFCGFYFHTSFSAATLFLWDVVSHFTSTGRSFSSINRFDWNGSSIRSPPFLMKVFHLQAPSPFACAISKHRGNKERELRMEETVLAAYQVPNHRSYYTLFCVSVFHWSLLT